MTVWLAQYQSMELTDKARRLSRVTSHNTTPCVNQTLEETWIGKKSLLIVLTFGRRTQRHTKTKPHSHICAFWLCSGEKKDFGNVNWHKTWVVALLDSCNPNVHRKATSKCCFQWFYEATVWCKQGHGANFERNFTEENLSVQNIKAPECHCVSYLHLWPPQPGARVEESCVYFKCTIYSEG